MYTHDGNPVGCVQITLFNQSPNKVGNAQNKSRHIDTFRTCELYRLFEEIFQEQNIYFLTEKDIQNPPERNEFLNRICTNASQTTLRFPVLLERNSLLLLPRANLENNRVWIQYYYTFQNNEYIVCEGITFKDWHQIINLSEYNIKVINDCRYSKTVIASKVNNVLFRGKLDFDQPKVTQRCLYYVGNQEFFVISLKFGSHFPLHQMRNRVASFLRQINRLLGNNINTKSAVYKAYLMSAKDLKLIDCGTYIHSNKWYNYTKKDIWYNEQWKSKEVHSKQYGPTYNNKAYTDPTHKQQKYVPKYDYSSTEESESDPIHTICKYTNTLMQPGAKQSETPHNTAPMYEYSTESESEKKQSYSVHTTQSETNTRAADEDTNAKQTPNGCGNGENYQLYVLSNKDQKTSEIDLGKYRNTFVKCARNEGKFVFLRKFHQKSGQFEALYSNSNGKWEWTSHKGLWLDTSTRDIGKIYDSLTGFQRRQGWEEFFSTLKSN